MIDDENIKTMFTKIKEPETLLQNRFAVRLILMDVVKNAYKNILEDKLLTKQQIAENMGEDPIVIDALLKSPDLWSFEMLADFLWGLNLNISGIILSVSGSEDDEENLEEENNENERIH